MDLPVGLPLVEPALVASRVRASYEADLGEVRAFLPGRVPLDDLPVAFASHLEACAELAERYPRGRGGVRAWLDRAFRVEEPAARHAIPRLDEAECDRLMTVLAVLGHTYRWDCVPPVPARFQEHSISLPEGIAGPWNALALRCGQPRVGTAWSLHLCNWEMNDRPGGATFRPEELTGDNVRARHNWLLPPYAASLDRFSISFVLMEARGAAVLEHLVRTVEAAARRRPEEAMASLERLQEAVGAMTLDFSVNVRRRTVDPDIWLELVQPTFAWGAATGSAGEVEGGPSGMQVGTIQALDAALGITGDSGLAAMARNGRRYMPPSHRRFLQTLDLAGPVVRRFVRQAACGDLTERFNRCIRAVGSFRATHRARGSQYLAARPAGGCQRASTGLVIAIDDDPAAVFERSMAARAAENHAALLT